MNYVDWKPEYSVGVLVFDEHHQHLLSLLNKLYEYRNAETEIKETLLHQVLEQLEAYAVYHFSEEEKAMTREYEEFDKHKKEHAFFIGTVKQLAAELEKGKKTISLHTFKFLNDWLVAHILETDRKLGLFLRHINNK